MSNIDFIDLFDDDNQGVSAAGHIEEPLSPIEIGPTEKISGSQRMRLNDYKHSSHTYQKAAPREKQAGPQAPGRSLKLDDEKIVWAGAIFVFFGVFVFLIGYWLGKATLKNVKDSNQQYLAGIQQKLDNEQLQNSMTIPVQDGGKVDSVTPQAGHEQQPTMNSPQAKNDLQPIVAPPINDPELKKTTPQPVKQVQPVEVKKTTPTPVKKTTTTTAPKNVKGDYTLQVSAHTNLEKARSIETQLRGKGMQAYIVESMVNGVRYFRVRVGKFNSKNEANTALSELRKSSIGKDAYLIRL